MLLYAGFYLIIGIFIAEIALRNGPKSIGFTEYLIATLAWPAVLYKVFAN